MLEDRHLFWRLDSEANYTNDTICILNDEHKVNILLLPKCASTTIRALVDHREKLFSKLNTEELQYTKICFIRPAVKRFYSGLSTIFKKEKLKDKAIELKEYIDKNDRTSIIKFILEHRDPHITSVSVHLKSINVDCVYDLNVLQSIGIHENVSSYKNREYVDKIAEMKIFEDDLIQDYYENDTTYIMNSSSYVSPKINKLFRNMLKVQKYLFILTPANGGSRMIASLIDSSENTTFARNKKYEGIMTIDPLPIITKQQYWYDTSYNFDCSKLMKIKWFDADIKCDKYPPYMIRAKDIESYFEQFGDVYFICSTRHPYSFNHQIEWNEHIKIMYENMKTLKNVHFLRYEDLLYNYENEAKRLLEFLPELKSLDRDKVETISTTRGVTKGIVDCQDYTKSRGNFDETYMKELGYITSEPYFEPLLNLS
jgi:hypothetical protein